MDIRPRTLGEILDDAWRLALADAPILLLFNAVFLLPAFCLLLLLLAQPSPPGFGQIVLPAFAALVLPLMGLASGSCQELLRRRTAQEPIAIRDCLVAALRHGVEHTAARAVLLCLVLPGPLLMLYSFLPDTSPILRFGGFLFGTIWIFLIAFPVWGASLPLHAVLSASKSRSTALVSELRRDVAAAPGAAAVMVFSRFALLLWLAIHLHLLAQCVLWVADNLGGFDLALLDVQLTFFRNPVYTLAVFLVSWLLLAPFFECGNCLLHTDIRIRQEGLDLQYRVQRAFGVIARPARAVLLLAGLLLLGQSAATAESPRETVRSVRQEIETIRAEVRAEEPYRGGQRWVNRLRSAQKKLARLNDGDARRFRWFERAITDFGDRKKDDALLLLDELQRRLALLEDSLPPEQDAETQRRSASDVKALLRGSEGRRVDRTQPRQPVEEERRHGRREEVRREERKAEAPGDAGADGGGEGGGGGGTGSVPTVSSGGLSKLGWILLGGLGLAVVVVGIFLYLTSPRSPRPARQEPVSGTEAAAPDNDGRQVLEESPRALWNQADTLANAGQFREAVRLLYLAVLAGLHRRNLIRFEPTRTNGEYVRQVRLSEQALPELHEPFESLTNQFETAWYGEQPCTDGDYRACRTLAEEVQQLAGSAA